MVELSEFCPLEILENGQWVRKMSEMQKRKFN